MAKQLHKELVVIGFHYDLLESKVADQLGMTAERIRVRIKKTVEDILEVGNDLLAVKEALPHGPFPPWLPAEFGWSERSAQNFMNVRGDEEEASQEAWPDAIRQIGWTAGESARTLPRSVGPEGTGCARSLTSGIR